MNGAVYYYIKTVHKVNNVISHIYDFVMSNEGITDDDDNIGSMGEKNRNNSVTNKDGVVIVY